jgi:hypothetical protein
MEIRGWGLIALSWSMPLFIRQAAQLRMCPLCHHSKSHCNSKNSSTFLRQERYSSIAFTTRQLDFPAEGGEDFHFYATTIA